MQHRRSISVPVLCSSCQGVNIKLVPWDCGSNKSLLLTPDEKFLVVQFRTLAFSHHSCSLPCRAAAIQAWLLRILVEGECPLLTFLTLEKTLTRLETLDLKEQYEKYIKSKHLYVLLVPFYHWSINAQKIMTSDVNSDLMSLGLAQVWLSVSGVAALRARDNFWLDFQGVDHLVFHRLFLFRTVKIPLLLLSLSLVRQVRAFRLCLKKARHGWLQTW